MSVPLAGMVALALVLGGCAAPASDAEAPAAAEEQPPADDATSAVPADGTYEIEAQTDSSMFRAERCMLTVEGGTYTVQLSLPGEGFSRLYWGSAEDAASADDGDVYDYYVNDEGLYTFDLPVEALDEDLPIAAFGHRRDTWYDHTIRFASPDASGDAE